MDPSSRLRCKSRLGSWRKIVIYPEYRRHPLAIQHLSLQVQPQDHRVLRHSRPFTNPPRTLFKHTKVLQKPAHQHLSQLTQLSLLNYTVLPLHLETSKPRLKLRSHKTPKGNHQRRTRTASPRQHTQRAPAHSNLSRT